MNDSSFWLNLNKKFLKIKLQNTFLLLLLIKSENAQITSTSTSQHVGFDTRKAVRKNKLAEVQA